MNLHPQDIIIRKTDGTETLWLSQRLVMEVCGIKEGTLQTNRDRYKKKGTRECDLAKAGDFMPKGTKSWRWAKTSNGFYYCLDNIPDRAPKHYRSMFGTAEELKALYNEQQNHRHQSSLERDFKDFLKLNAADYLHLYEGYNEVQRRSLAKACAVVEYILTHKEDYQGTKNKIYKDLEPILKAMDLQYIPHNPIRLKEKVEEAEESSIADVIKLPREGNAHAKEYHNPIVMAWAVQLWSSGANYPQEYIIRKVMELCELYELKAPSRRWFGRTIFEQPKMKFLTAEKRFGKGTTRSALYSGYTPSKGAINAGDCWQIDATRLNMIAHKGSDGEMQFLWIITVRDVYSGDYVGYTFHISENRWAYMDALMNAVKNTGYLPYEIVTDKFPGHNTEEVQKMFEKITNLGCKWRITTDPKGKSAVERAFGTMQTTFLQDSKFFYGEGIKSSNTYAHRSPEYIAKVKKEANKEGFDLNMAWNEAEQCVENMRNTPYSKYSRKYKHLHESPAERHENAEKPNVLWVNKQQISFIFSKQRKIKVRNQGQMVVEIKGAIYHYRIEDYEKMATYTNLYYTYDFEDLNQIYLYREYGPLSVFLCEAKLFEEVVMHGPNAQLGKLAREKQRRDKIERWKEAEHQKIVAPAEDTLLMGKMTDKVLANNTEYQLIAQEPMEIKKASGSDVHHEAESLEHMLQMKAALKKL